MEIRRFPAKIVAANLRSRFGLRRQVSAPCDRELRSSLRSSYKNLFEAALIAEAKHPKKAEEAQQLP